MYVITEPLLYALGIVRRKGYGPMEMGQDYAYQKSRKKWIRKTMIRDFNNSDYHYHIM